MIISCLRMLTVNKSLEILRLSLKDLVEAKKLLLFLLLFIYEYLIWLNKRIKPYQDFHIEELILWLNLSFFKLFSGKTYKPMMTRNFLFLFFTDNTVRRSFAHFIFKLYEKFIIDIINSLFVSTGYNDGFFKIFKNGFDNAFLFLI